MKEIRSLTYKAGEYKGKAKWQRHGIVMIESENIPEDLKISVCLPVVGQPDVWLSAYKREAKDEQQEAF